MEPVAGTKTGYQRTVCPRDPTSGETGHSVNHSIESRMVMPPNAYMSLAAHTKRNGFGTAQVCQPGRLERGTCTLSF